MAYDIARQECVLFGGGMSSTSYADTWTWDGQRWQLATTTVAPSRRTILSMVFDAARGEMVLFGGYTYGTLPTPTVYHGDTWSWNGTAWTQRAPANAPSARMGYALAYHAPSQRVVLFGGGTTAAALADTWTWDGANWTQQNPASSPPARVGAAMAATSQDLVLFGGAVPATGAWTARDDTWLWDGANWSQRVTANTPSARYYTSMAYDEVDDRVLLTGGYPMPTQVVADVTWSFDGTDWTPLQLAYDPLVRYGNTVVRDVARGQTLLFGGVRFSAQNDLWALGPAAEESPFGAGCPGALGAPQVLPTANSSAVIGGVARADLVNLPLSFAILTIGFSDTMAGSTPLPLSLAPYGMPGCDLLVSPDAILLVTGANQTASWQLPIPFAAAFVDFDLFVQALALDPTANAAGATTSNGVRYRIGG